MTIGVLLPRSTDHPAMGFDLLDGLRLRLRYDGLENVRILSENIGFGEDKKDIYAKAEKLIMQEEADCVLGYLSPANAEALYPLFDTAGKTLIVLDPGMNYPATAPSPNVFYISFQGIHASYLSGRKAGENGTPVVLATSFYDGGYRGPWAHARGVEAAGGSISHNYVAQYKEEDFTLQPFIEAFKDNTGGRVAASFSTFLATRFVNALHSAGDALPSLEFYCSPYMLEEQTVTTYNLPGSKFFAFVPWFSGMEQESNMLFRQEVSDKKNKEANLFHLMGWEGGILIARLFTGQGSGASSQELLNGWAYESPRGTVNIHPETQTTYAPLYLVELTSTEKGASITLHGKEEINAMAHKEIWNDRPQGMVSGWVNQYFCT